MGFDSVDIDRELLATPDLSPGRLAEIAARRPDLWASIRAHPNNYPGLDAWIVERSTPSNVPAAPQPLTSTPPRRNRVGLWITLVAVVVLAVGGGVWLVTGRQTEDVEKLYASLPRLSSAAAIGQPDEPVSLIPVGGAAYIPAGTILIAAAEIGGEETLVGLEEGVLGLPAWVANVSSPLSQCQLQGEMFICGDEQVSVSTGVVTKPSSSAAATPDSEEGIGTDDAEGLDGTDSDSEDANDAEDTGAQPTLTTPGDNEFYIEEGELMGTDGEVLMSFPFTPVWQQASSGGVTIFSDGSKLAGVKGNKVLWELELPEGAREVNMANSETPPFHVDGETIVIGEPSGMVGVNAKTGEETWRLDTPVDSWLLSGETLILGSEGTIYELKFPTAGQTDQVGAQELEKLDVPTALSYDDLANMSLKLPEDCGTGAGTAGEDFVFQEGRNETKMDGTLLDAVEPLLSAGKAFSVALFSYQPWRGTPALCWGIYDVDAKLVAEGSMTEVPGLGQYPVPYPNSYGSLSTSGPTFSYTLEEVALMNGSTDITVTHLFDGNNTEVADVVFHLPSGDMRAPNQQQVQELYDMVAEGKEDQVEGQIVAEELDLIKNLFLGAGTSPSSAYRKWLYPEGGTVSNCVLARASYRRGEMVTDDAGIGFMGTDMDYGTSHFEPGAWLCGVLPASEDGSREDYFRTGTSTMYQMGLRILTDAEGTPTLVGTERTFS